MVVVGSGEIVPVDGEIATDEALIDESTLTGEPLPATRRRGDPVRSGVANAGSAFELRDDPAGRRERVRGARAAGRRRPDAAGAPFVRVADRYAAYFLPFALGVAGIAWAATGDPRSRARGPGRRDAVPAHPRGADRTRGRASRGPRRSASSSRAPASSSSLGGARSVLLDKTGYRHRRRADRRARRCRRTDGCRRAAAPRGLARPALGPHRRARPRARGAARGARAACAGAGGRGAGRAVSRGWSTGTGSRSETARGCGTGVPARHRRDAGIRRRRRCDRRRVRRPDRDRRPPAPRRDRPRAAHSGASASGMWRWRPVTGGARRRDRQRARRRSHLRGAVARGQARRWSGRCARTPTSAP